MLYAVLLVLCWVPCIMASCDLSTGRPFIYDWQLDESAPIDTLIGELPLSQEPAEQLTVRLVQGAPLLRLDPQARQLYLNGTVDRDQGVTQLRAVVECHSLLLDTNAEFKVNISVVVNVLDANDNGPVFELPEYFVNITEELPEGTVVFDELLATDNDQPGPNSMLSYSIDLNQPHAELLSIDQSWTGRLSIGGRIDYESLHEFTVFVVAEDEGQPSRSSRVPVHVTVVDVDDLNPVFTYSTYYAVLSKDTQPNSKIDVLPAKIEATDGDTLNASIQYSLTGEEADRFSIGPNGILNLIDTLPQQKTVVLQVTAHQSDRPERQTQTSVRLTIAGGTTASSLVTDTDPDNNQTIDDSHTDVQAVTSLRFTRAMYSVNVSETVPIGTQLVRVVANNNQQEESALLYSIEQPIDYPQFNMDPRSGVMTVVVALDYETHHKFEIPVKASDGQQSASAVVQLLVLDANDHAPVFSQSLYEFSPDVRVSRVLGQVYASDQDTNDQLTYELLSNTKQFAVNAIGILSVRNDSSLEANRKYEIVVSVHDNGSPPRRSHATVLVSVGEALAAIAVSPAPSRSALAMLQGWVWIVALSISLLIVALLFTALVVFACKRKRANGRRRSRYPQYVLPSSRWMKPQFGGLNSATTSTGPLHASTASTDSPQHTMAMPHANLQTDVVVRSHAQSNQQLSSGQQPSKIMYNYDRVSAPDLREPRQPTHHTHVWSTELHSDEQPSTNSSHGSQSPLHAPRSRSRNARDQVPALPRQLPRSSSHRLAPVETSRPPQLHRRVPSVNYDRPLNNAQGDQSQYTIGMYSEHDLQPNERSVASTQATQQMNRHAHRHSNHNMYF